MSSSLRNAMREFLDGWQADMPQAWREHCASAAPDFEAIGDDLELEIWEPIFPVRRSRHFPGMPKGAHLFRAYDDIAPEQVSCVILGQDPYPEPGFATGRAFEAGNVAEWRELDKMFSRSIRAFTQLIVAARTGDTSYTCGFFEWPRTLRDIEQGAIEMEAPSAVADRWVRQGVLLLNASFTLTRFQVGIDPHQSRGHVPLWRPIVQKTLAMLAGSGRPIVFIAFGDVAAEAFAAAGIREGRNGNITAILRDHPARADAVLERPNPFILCNDFLEEMGSNPIAW
ncbi:uracil-DNA glycosylase [Rhizobium sp. PL01]|uniref:uracil-DNA glycosylase n=1 Tax=Rhizobium sp. PL01 TaxID=3085631 RepID=UPI0029820640|nr:uracil-DNA glycosylase [Rhizobium sp. PL01]MDW5317019.1 uracil-DNA glycosylase [Rhizobium sp. PL01]